MSEVNRRQAIAGMFGAAAGLTALPRRAVAAAAPTGPGVQTPPAGAPTFPPGWDWQHDPLREEELNAEQRLRKSSCQAVLMAVLWEAESAMRAVLDMLDKAEEEDDDDTVRADADGLVYHLGYWSGLIEGESPRPCIAHARREWRRACRAFEAGQVHCGCPVAWGQAALEGAEAALDAVRDRLFAAGDGDTGLAHDAKAWGWFINLASDIFNCDSCGLMNQEAKDAETRRVLAEYGLLPPVRPPTPPIA